MERLTFLNGDEIPCVRNDQCFEEQSEHYCGPAIDRLAAYEDTHMMPPDVMHMRMDMAILTALFDGIDVDRMREIVAAERGGRVVVLPCKVGDTVWVTGRDSVPREMKLEAPDIRAVCTDEENLCMSTCNRKPDGFCAYRLRNDGTDIGKTVFLTREEAEKALEVKK